MLCKSLTAALVLFISTLLSTSQAENWTLERVEQVLSAPKSVSARFAQERTIAAMPRPLRSSGRMLLDKEQGLLWQQETPFALTMHISAEGIVQQGADGTREELSFKDNPTLYEFSSFIRALFLSDLSTLKQSFEVELSEAGDKWQLLLTPKTAPLNQIFKEIELLGGSFIERISLADAQGDATVITLSEQAAAEDLNAADQALFDAL